MLLHCQPKQSTNPQRSSPTLVIARSLNGRERRRICLRTVRPGNELVPQETGTGHIPSRAPKRQTTSTLCSAMSRRSAQKGRKSSPSSSSSSAQLAMLVMFTEVFPSLLSTGPPRRGGRERVPGSALCPVVRIAACQPQWLVRQPSHQARLACRLNEQRSSAPNACSNSDTNGVSWCTAWNSALPSPLSQP